MEPVSAHYGPLGVACTYEGLRQTIRRRYLSGYPKFDALTVVEKFWHAGYSSGGYYESKIGEDYESNPGE